MEMTNEKIVEKKVYEEDKRKDEYASKGVAGTALGLGIAGTALGLMPWLFGGGRSNGVVGGVQMPENVNINANGFSSAAAPTALHVEEKECADVLNLTNEMWGLKLDTANKFYAMRNEDISEKFSMYKGYTEGIFGLYKKQNDDAFALYKGYTEGDARLKDAMTEQGFALYKNQRDLSDATNAKISALETKVAVMEAIRPYQDKLLMDYTDRKTCRCIQGQLVLPNTPVVSGYGSYASCGCAASATPTTPTA